ncbi:MAG: hypothetical protein VXZ96_19625 [Myxococcota bacterium]|nr:hypothetical protein [Myxococcota bacterium]
MMILFVLALGCITGQPAQNWSDIPGSKYCTGAEVHTREKCRIDECRAVIQRSGAPKANDVPTLTLLCERAEASNTESAQACGLQACYYLPQLSLADGMRLLQSSLPTAASQKRARSAILRGLLEQEANFALALDSAKQDVLKNSAGFGLAVAELDCTANGISESLGLACPEVTAENVSRILELAEVAKDNTTELHTLLNMAAAADFSVAAPVLTAMLTESETDAVKAAVIAAIQVALLRGDRIPRDLVGQWVKLCDAAPIERKRICEQMMN